MLMAALPPTTEKAAEFVAIRDPPREWRSGFAFGTAASQRGVV
jgi:hypothetical protein